MNQDNPSSSPKLSGNDENLPVSKPQKRFSGSPGSKERILALVLLIIISVSAGFIGGYFGGQQSDSGLYGQGSGSQGADNEGSIITRIARDVGPSVVSVNVTSEAVRETFLGDRPIVQQSAGTGVIIDSDGTIVTNRHVIPEGVTSVGVTLSDGTEIDNVEVIGRTNENDPLDIAFLKIDQAAERDLKAAKLGDSGEVEVGQRVIAIGNALGRFENSVTSGIISGYGRNVVAGQRGDLETLQNLFQTDAAINQGNSGGPLVSLNGEVIGINTAVAGGSAQSIGFAIPINDIKGLIRSVLDTGELQRPYIGVRYIPLTDDYASQNDLEVTRGAYVVPGEDGMPSIVPGSPADQAGLQEGDIITKVNDQDINERNSLISALGGYSVGETVTLTIVRGDQQQTVEVELKAAPTS